MKIRSDLKISVVMVFSIILMSLGNSFCYAAEPIVINSFSNPMTIQYNSNDAIEKIEFSKFGSGSLEELIKGTDYTLEVTENDKPDYLKYSYTVTFTEEGLKKIYNKVGNDDEAEIFINNTMKVKVKFNIEGEKNNEKAVSVDNKIEITEEKEIEITEEKEIEIIEEKEIEGSVVKTGDSFMALQSVAVIFLAGLGLFIFKRKKLNLYFK